MRQLLLVLVALFAVLAVTETAVGAPKTAEGEYSVVHIHEDGGHYEHWLTATDRRYKLKLKHKDKEKGKDGDHGHGHQEEALAKPGSRLRVNGDLAGADLAVDSVEVLAPAAAVDAARRRSVLVMLVTWTVPDTVTPARAVEQIGTTDDAWFGETSAGAMGTTATATPWLTIPASSCSDLYGLLDRARAAARARGFEPTSYDHEMVYFPNAAACSGSAGWGEVGGRVTWLNGYLDTRVSVHELGHNLGLWHANSLACRDAAGQAVTLTADAAGCTHTEYGDPFDAMGGSSHVGHFNAAHKAALGWLPGQTQTVTGNATVALTPLESGPGLKGAVVATQARNYWLEYRQPSGLDLFLSGYPGATDGVLIHSRIGSDGTHLLDARADDSNWIGDAALGAGASWVTPEGIAFRVESATGTEARVSVRMPPVPNANLVVNPSFESSASDWGGWQGSVARVALADAPHGAYAARVARSTGTSYTINDTADGRLATVTSTVAGARYSGAASVKAASSSAVGKPVRLVLRELTPAMATVREWSATTTLSTAFKRLAVDATPTASGNQLDIRVSQSSAVAGDAFYADDFSLMLVRDTTAPTVASVTPADGTTGAPTSTSVSAAFSEAMDGPATQAAFTVVRSSDGASVAGTATWSGTTLSFRPAAALAPGTAYTARVGTGARDLAGNALLAAREWRFTTQAAATNLVGNPSFETSLQDWSGWQATASRVALTGAPHGAYVARVARSTGTTYTINDGLGRPGVIPVTTAGATYRATAWVRGATSSSNGKPVRIILRERTPAGATVRESASSSTLSTASFRQLTVNATIVASGNSLDLRVSQGSAVAGDAFYADQFVVVRTP